jgi:hypothetical protein
MAKWLFAALPVLEAHFAASHIVPLDEEAQRTFGGLLGWARPVELRTGSGWGGVFRALPPFISGGMNEEVGQGWLWEPVRK